MLELIPVVLGWALTHTAEINAAVGLIKLAVTEGGPLLHEAEALAEKAMPHIRTLTQDLIRDTMPEHAGNEKVLEGVMPGVRAHVMGLLERSYFKPQDPRFDTKLD